MQLSPFIITLGIPLQRLNHSRGCQLTWSYVFPVTVARKFLILELKSFGNRTACDRPDQKTLAVSMIHL